MTSRYFVRVLVKDEAPFLEHLSRHGIDHELLSRDLAAGEASNLYSIMLENDEALALKLSFPLKGCMNFNATMGKQVANVVHGGGSC